MAANRAHGTLLQVDIGVVFSRIRSAPAGHKKGSSRNTGVPQKRTAIWLKMFVRPNL